MYYIYENTTRYIQKKMRRRREIKIARLFVFNLRVWFGC